MFRAAHLSPTGPACHLTCPHSPLLFYINLRWRAAAEVTPFPTVCWSQIKCGSFQIWVSGSFLHSSYFEHLIQPCSSLPAAGCPPNASTFQARWSVCTEGTTAHVQNSTWRLETRPNKSINYPLNCWKTKCLPKPVILTSRPFANWSECKCVWTCKLTRRHEVHLHVQSSKSTASESKARGLTPHCHFI